MPLIEPLVTSPDTKLLDILKVFQTGKSHLALLSEHPACALEYLQKQRRPPQHAAFLGMVTLEDVIEKIIQDEIRDETDGVRGTKEEVNEQTEAKALQMQIANLKIPERKGMRGRMGIINYPGATNNASDVVRSNAHRSLDRMTLLDDRSGVKSHLRSKSFTVNPQELASVDYNAGELFQAAGVKVSGDIYRSRATMNPRQKKPTESKYQYQSIEVANVNL